MGSWPSLKFLHLYISRCHGFLRDPKLALARDVIVSSATTTAAPAAVGQQQAEAVETQLRCLQTVSGRQKLALRRVSAALRESGMVYGQKVAYIHSTSNTVSVGNYDT